MDADLSKALWCPVCMHGLKEGTIGSQCPVCIEKWRDRPGIVVTAEQAMKDTKARASATKLLRSQTIRGQKTLEDHKAEVESKIRSEYDAKLAAMEAKIALLTKPSGAAKTPAK